MNDAHIKKFVDESLEVNKDCNILYCYMNDYTDRLKVSYGYLASIDSIVYRINTIQTKPNIRQNIIGYYPKNLFETFVKDTINNFTTSINIDKVYHNWDASVVYADNLHKQHDIQEWKGENLQEFMNIINDITHNVIDCIV